MGPAPLFATARLTVRMARPVDRDIDFYYALWTNPDVMRFVGFPSGLRTTRDKILRSLMTQGDSPFDALLLVERTEDGQIIGECKLGSPDTEGIAHTDVKLLPQFWGRGFGTELKHALVRYLFVYTTCGAVQATPNRENVASQKMQEAVGARRISEGVYHFPEHLRDHTTNVPYVLYRIERKEWESSQCPQLVLEGRGVTLRTTLPSDLTSYARWNNPDLRAWQLDAPWFTDDLSALIASRKAWLVGEHCPPFRSLEIEADDATHIGWVVVYLRSDDPHSTEFGIDICEDSHWGRGLGTEACVIWIDYLLEEFALTRLGYSTWDGNLAMLRIGHRLGFVEEGRIRQACVVNGAFHDRVKMGILQSEWAAAERRRSAVARGRRSTYSGT